MKTLTLIFLQTLIIRMHAALGVETPHTESALFLKATDQMNSMELRMAMIDLFDTNPAAFQQVNRRIQDGDEELTLIQACRQMNVGAARDALCRGVNPLERGGYGETVFHWLALLPWEESYSLVVDLLDQNLSPVQVTKDDALVGAGTTFFQKVLAGTTALQWALQSDNESIFKILMDDLQDRRISFNITSHLCTAVQCQSIKCLRYLCSWLKESNQNADCFDGRGFSPLYYAIMSDPVEQVLRFRPSMGMKQDQDPLAPYMRRYLDVIKVLLDVCPSMAVHPNRHFNIIHLAANLDTPLVLNQIAEYLNKRVNPTGKHNHAESPVGQSLIRLVNEYSYAGVTPMYTTIENGFFDNFRWLLDHGAGIRSLNSNFKQHAIHVCGLYAGKKTTNFAEELRLRDKGCLKVPNGLGYTPLHHAAFYGNRPLAEYLIANGVNINTHSDKISGLTPLGAAIAGRSLPLVKFFLETLEATKRPVYARKWLEGSLDPLHYLLQPRTNFGDLDHKHHNMIDIFDRGCLDFPFSNASREILDCLLAKPRSEHPLRRQIGQWLLRPLSFWTPNTAIFWAVRMTSFYAVERMIDMGYYKGNFKDLLDKAYRQNSIGLEHVSTDADRKAMIEYLLEKQDAQFEKMKAKQEHHRTAILRYMFRIRDLYRRMAQLQYTKALKWRNDNRLTFPPYLISPFDIIDFPIDFRARFISVWILLLIIITCVAIASFDPTSKYSSKNAVCLVVTIVLVSLNVAVDQSSS